MRDREEKSELLSAPAITRGRLRDTRMPALLWYLHESQATGSLILRREGVEKQVWFAAGEPIFSRSNQSEDRLTDRLLERGLLSRAQYESAQALIANKGSRRSGEVLVEAGLIRQSALDEALQEHLLHNFDSMFIWDDAEWSFDPDGRCDEKVTLGTHTLAIIMGAARNRLHLAELWAAVGERSQRPTLVDPGLAPGLTRDLELLPTEAAWLGRFNGAESLSELLADFDTDERELISLVFTLKLIGALTGGAP
ncbi:MAG: DUF4388 domain-containing protein [Nannocystaceae bacterium]